VAAKPRRKKHGLASVWGTATGRSSKPLTGVFGLLARYSALKQGTFVLGVCRIARGLGEGRRPGSIPREALQLLQTPHYIGADRLQIRTTAKERTRPKSTAFEPMSKNDGRRVPIGNGQVSNGDCESFTAIKQTSREYLDAMESLSQLRQDRFAIKKSAACFSGRFDALTADEYF